MQVQSLSLENPSERLVIVSHDAIGIYEIELSDGTRIGIQEEGDAEIGAVLSLNIAENRMLIQPRAANSAWISELKRKRARRKRNESE